MPINGKNRTPDSMTFNGVEQIELTTGAQNVGASESVNTVLAAVPVSVPLKVVRVSCTAQAVSGVNAEVQLVYGTDAPSAPPTLQDQNAVNGTAVFTAPVAINFAANAMVTIAPANMNTVYQPGECLTVRAATDATSTVTGLRVFADVVRFDGRPTHPQFNQLGPTDF